MANRNGAKGSKFETDVLKWLREYGFDAEKIPDTGSKDESDVVVKQGGMPHVLELKNWGRMDLARFLREAELERDHYETARGYDETRLKGYFAALVKRRNHGIKDAYLVMPLREWARLIADNDPPF